MSGAPTQDQRSDRHQHGLRRYRRLLAVPGARRVLVLSTLARLPIGMTGLALLLLVQARTGSFAEGGLVSSSFTVALAAASPLRGSAVDRRGGRSVLLLYGALHPALLLALLAVISAEAATWAVLALAVAAGSTFPPVGPLARALWGVLYVDEGDRSTAYALDAVLIELAFIGGPIVVGLAVAFADAGVAVVVAALLVGGGSLLLAAAPATARLAPRARSERAPLHAPLTSGEVRLLLLALTLLGAAFGTTEVGVAAFAVEEGARAWTGGVLAVWATGSAVGGLLYGARAWRRGLDQQYPLLVAVLAVALTLPLLAQGMGTLAALLLLGGAGIAPFSACNSALLARAAPAGATTATFAWSGSCIVAGIAVGTGAAGWLVEHASGPVAGATAAFLLGSGAGALALATALVRTRTVGGPRAQPGS